MKSLNVKVGDKGTYSENRAPCEVVFVKPDRGDYFVTSSGAFVPQVHDAAGKSVRHPPGEFDFVPKPQTVRVAVWLDDAGIPRCASRPADNPAPRYPETVIELEVPR